MKASKSEERELAAVIDVPSGKFVSDLTVDVAAPVTTCLEKPSSTSSHHRRRTNSGVVVADLGRTLQEGLHTSMELIRTLSQTEELLYCQICREYTLSGNTFRFRACGHRFCRDCIAQYLELKVKEGQVYPTCFYSEEEDAIMNMENPKIPEPCATLIAEEDVEALVCEKIRMKYRKFKFNKEHNNARNCPFCDSAELGDPQHPEMVCSNCNKPFCYAHSSAHPNMNCTEYEKLMLEENRKNDLLISTIAKACPGCGNPVEKSGGCNQMKCMHCSCHFCWLCGKKVDGGTFPNHFQWWNVTGCPNMQMQENVEAPPKSHIIMYKTLSVLEILIIGPVASALGIVFYSVCLPFVLIKACMDKQQPRIRTHFVGCVSFWGNILILIILVPLFLVVAVAFFFFTFICLIVATCKARLNFVVGQGPAEAEQEQNRKRTPRSQELERGVAKNDAATTEQVVLEV